MTIKLFHTNIDEAFQTIGMFESAYKAAGIKIITHKLISAIKGYFIIFVI